MTRHPVAVTNEPEPLVGRLAATVSDVVPSVHPAGRPFVAGGVALALLGWRFAPVRTGGIVAALAAALFFRNPSRVPPTDPGLAVAPADGEVTLVDVAVPPAELGLGTGALPRVQIAVSLTDAHVQRAPVAGIIRRVENVTDEHGSDQRSAVAIETRLGIDVGVVQAAGLVAGRIACDAELDATVELGEPVGLTRVGSRVDTYLPAGTAPLVGVGQHTIAGETPLARLS